jgi:hypothetical protein
VGYYHLERVVRHEANTIDEGIKSLIKIEGQRKGISQVNKILDSTDSIKWKC